MQQDEGITTSDLIDAGDYDIKIGATGENSSLTCDPVSDSDDVATVTLNGRGASEFRRWTAPDGTNVNDLEDVNEALADGEITQSSEICDGDIVVHQLVVSDFEGPLNAQQDEDVEDAFFNNIDSNVAAGSFYNVTVKEASPGANQDTNSLTLNRSNTGVIADGPNNAYVMIFDTDGSVRYGDHSAIEDNTELEANLSVLSNDQTDLDYVSEDGFDSDENEGITINYDVVEPDITVTEPFNVSQAEAQMITGTTTLAPGTDAARAQSAVSARAS